MMHVSATLLIARLMKSSVLLHPECMDYSDIPLSSLYLLRKVSDTILKGIVIVGSRIDYTVFIIIMRKIITVLSCHKCEFQYFHSRITTVF